MKISSRFLLGVAALLWEAAVLDSCRDYIPDNFHLYNYSQYENFRAITVNNPCDDHYLSIYYDQPFSEEGGVQAKEYLGGKGPFTMQLNVPSHVKQLYVVDNGVLTVHPVGDLVVGEKTRGLEYTSDELTALYNHVTTTYLPTAKYNVTGDDLFKCTDIRLERDGNHDDQDIAAFNISLIDLMDKKWDGSGKYTGEKNKFIGNLFAYVYPKEKQHHLKLEDCIFFGANPDGYASGTTFSAHMDAVHNEMGLAEEDKKICPLKQIPEATMRAMGEYVRSKKSSLTADKIKTEYSVWPLLNAHVMNRAHIVISLPVAATDLFPNGCEGYNLGFVYLGGQNLRFTTPALNIGFPGPGDQQYADYPGEEAGNYLGYELKYEDACYNDGEHNQGAIGNGTFVLDRHVANGFIWHFKYKFGDVVKEYDVLGMDNQYPFNKQTFYDADYADYKVLISTDPEYLKPVEELLKPIHTPFTLEEGYYLFEDTYPNEGDYDYNDVIVQYEWRYYPKDDQGNEHINRVNCTLEGYACAYTNTFGFINTHENAEQTHHPIFSDIHGQMNVTREPSFIDLEADGTRDFEYEFVGEKNYIFPYLNNGRGDVYEEQGGNFSRPFVLKVPEILDASEHEFRWTIEGARLEDAYKSITGDGWYLPTNIKNENKLMKRHEFTEGLPAAN